MQDIISFGQPDQTWSKYGLAENPISVNSGKSDKKAIIKDGQLVTIVSDKYVLLPNEEALIQADTIAKEAGLIPFDQFSGLHLKMHGGKGHTVVFGPQNARFNAMYAIEKEYKVNGEQMWVGINIQNSIDGSKAFGAGIFSFRSACKNMALVAAATQNGWKLHIAKQQTIETISKRHTKSIDPQTFKLKLVISQIMSKATGLIDAYEQMATQKATEELLLSLGNSRLSKNVLPDYITEETVQAPEDLTVWETYNDITAQIWHNTKSDMTSKTFQFNTLHQIIPP